MIIFDPKVSAPVESAAIDTSSYQTLVVVGQSNTATAGLYKDLENLSITDINTKFGANSHIAACLRDAVSCFSNSLVKPKLWCASYADNGSAVARILEVTAAGTSTEEKTLKIRINSVNPDRVATQEAAIAALRTTKGSYVSEFSLNGTLFGSPRNAKGTFTPKLTRIKENDTIIEVVIPSGTTAAAAAALINTAINASASALYGSSVTDEVLTLTAKHKGSLGNFFTIEFEKTSTPAGLSFTIVEDTAGSGVVDISGLLDLTDINGTKLGDDLFNFMVMPVSYSSTAVVNDAKAKWDNVTAYNNQSKPYQIFRATAIDTSSTSAINTLAGTEPVEAKGVVKNLFVLKLSGFIIKGLNSYTEITNCEAKQFTCIKYDPTSGNYFGGACFSLSNEPRFKDFESVKAIMVIRAFSINSYYPANFAEKEFADSEDVDGTTLNKDAVISILEVLYDILDGTNVNTEFGDDYKGVIVGGSLARTRYSQTLQETVKFDSSSEQLSAKLLQTLSDPIRSILFINAFK